MNVKGIYRSSLIDYPGVISAVIFTGGCNLRCRFCHNPELAIDSSDIETVSDADILSFLSTRKRLLDGVVISGGEPTMRENLPLFCESLKSLGFKVKLDTNGSAPEKVGTLLSQGLVDYVALDMKTSPDKYKDVTCSGISFDSVMETLTVIRNAGVDYELRTTCAPGCVTMDDFRIIQEKTGRVKKYFLQQFRNENTLDCSLSDTIPYSKEEMYSFREYVATFSDLCELRGV
ncbi:MAG: anaerobic ribonucleoside-triphosphate reductase activating protein [Spirochaetota bacterium]